MCANHHRGVAAAALSLSISLHRAGICRGAARAGRMHRAPHPRLVGLDLSSLFSMLMSCSLCGTSLIICYSPLHLSDHCVWAGVLRMRRLCSAGLWRQVALQGAVHGRTDCPARAARRLYVNARRNCVDHVLSTLRRQGPRPPAAMTRRRAAAVGNQRRRRNPRTRRAAMSRRALQLLHPARVLQPLQGPSPPW